MNTHLILALALVGMTFYAGWESVRSYKKGFDKGFALGRLEEKHKGIRSKQ